MKLTGPSVHRLMPEWIILAREARGMEPCDLSEAARFSLARLQAIELGDGEITTEELRRVACALECPPSFFLRSDEPSDAQVMHLRCLADDSTVAEVEEPFMRARLRCLVRDLSARSLRDAILAIKDIRSRELREIESPIEGGS